MNPLERRQTAAWALLVIATLSSFWANSHSGAQLSAVAVIMTIAAFKVVVVLRHFMGADRLALPMRLYFYAWAIGCAVMIAVIVGISGRVVA